MFKGKINKQISFTNIFAILCKDNRPYKLKRFTPTMLYNCICIRKNCLYHLVLKYKEMEWNTIMFIKLKAIFKITLKKYFIEKEQNCTNVYRIDLKIYVYF